MLGPDGSGQAAGSGAGPQNSAVAPFDWWYAQRKPAARGYRPGALGFRDRGGRPRLGHRRHGQGRHRGHGNAGRRSGRVNREIELSTGTGQRDRAGWLRRDAERISGSLPPLLVEAERLALSLIQGVHGRRRSGPGESFWQYRPAHPGDTLGMIDWRRSARSDRLFVRELEWEAAETVMLWCDRSRAMDYHSAAVERTKADRAKLLTLALGVLLSRGGERFGLIGTAAEQAKTGERQIMQIGGLLAAPESQQPDYGAPPHVSDSKTGRVVFFSDFMGPEEKVVPSLTEAAGQGISGILVQILDPAEETFPFAGRTRFESMGREIRYETDQAISLREAYIDRLARRRDALAALARRVGWHLILHRTDESPRKALLALHGILGGN
ncbi:DUF58 domain-containing protein [Rhodobacteraceae bacterium NNCM2]|nr:DUF58 domain-containing protein [Coraliihabitans acroporae]